MSAPAAPSAPPALRMPCDRVVDVPLAHETLPLLHAARHDRRPTPLPLRQLVSLCAIRLADPIAFTQIFPYVNEMMASFGVATDPSKVGFYSGLVESVFAVSQSISIYPWARLSDTIGRRPVMFAGTLGIALTSVLLGFSKTLFGVLAARFLAGIFSGNVAVMHSVLGELTDSTNQAIAFPIYGLCWPIGVIIGPLIGGMFSNPAQKFPRWFNTELFLTFPYLLPCLIVALVATMGVVVGFYFLDETLPCRQQPRPLQRDISISFGVAEHRDDLLHYDAPPTTKALLSIPIMKALCVSGFALSFVGTAFDVVFVLFCYSPILTGGLAFSASQIGYALALAGLSSASIQVFVMPSLLRRFSTASLYKFCMALWPYAFVSLPILNILAREGLDDLRNTVDNQTRALLWIGVGCALTLSRIACLAYSLNMILVKDCAPSPASLGTANGLTQFSQCIARAISPTFVSSLFAFSIEKHILGGHLWAIVMVILSFLSWLHSTEVIEGSLIKESDYKTEVFTPI